nr:hypothetical protein [uncultured Sphingomonas sp.]
MIRLDTTGRNRLVLVTRRHAVKLPSLRCWRDFLFGLLNNLNEAAWHRDHADYCPVIWAAPLGLLLVMPRAQILNDMAFDHIEWCLPALPGVERKASSWGWLGGRLVAVDYGWR